MNRASLTPFTFFFVAAFILMSMTVVRADIQGQQHQKNIEEKIEKLENRIQQLKVEAETEDSSLWRRFSVNVENFKDEAGIRLAGFRESSNGRWDGIEGSLQKFFVDARKFYEAVKKKYFEVKTETTLKVMTEKKAFRDNISVDELTRQKFKVFDEKVRMTRQKLYQMERAGIDNWEETRDEAELALSEARVIYQQLN